MSAADRIEAIAEWMARLCEPDYHKSHYRIDEDMVSEKPFTSPIGCYCNEAKNLRAIAAELRGAPVLTEAERAFFEAALVLAEMRQTGVEFSVFEHSDRTANFDAAYRALRTERTPS